MLQWARAAWRSVGAASNARMALEADAAVPVVAQPAPHPLHEQTAAPLPVVTVSSLPDSRVRAAWDDGTKFPGGFGPTLLLTTDYWTLRKRSAQLFETNHYGRGLIRRLITNEINTGLHLEVVPKERLLGLPEDALADWSEDVEERFALYEKAPWLCHHAELLTFGALQRCIRAEALVEGDVLCMLLQHPVTRLPRVKVVCGSNVRTPLGVTPRKGSTIKHGVEVDEQGRHLAYWVKQSDGTSKRVPAWGEKSGRRLAWLYYGGPKRHDEIRGKPILALMLQSLKEIDRYRDSTQRKAVINSMIAGFVKKGEAKPGTQPLTGGAVRRSVEVIGEGAGSIPRVFRTAEHIPGLWLDELQHGEEPVAFNSNGTDEKFGDFEAAILSSIAWGEEIPPEILMLSFRNNYSASQAAINEFKIRLNLVRTGFGEDVCQPIYEDWFLSMVLAGKIKAEGYLEAWRDDTKYDTTLSWTSSDWAGHIKPAVDLSKLVGGYEKMIAIGAITRDRASRELTGTKYSANVKKLKRENEQLAEANAPLLALEQPPPSSGSSNNTADPERQEQDDDDNERAA